MSASVTDLPWFALQVRAAREKHIGCLLKDKGYTEFVPLYRARRRWSDRVKEIELPLFPGYLFCRLDLRYRLPVLTTPGVFGIVGAGKSLIPVDDSEVEAIQAIVRSGQDTLPWNYLQAGYRVQVEEGPLQGLQGILVEFKKRNRLVVSVTLLQRSVAVEVDREWLRPIRKPFHPEFASAVAAAG